MTLNVTLINRDYSFGNEGKGFNFETGTAWSLFAPEGG